MCKARCGPICGCWSCRRRSTARGSPNCFGGAGHRKRGPRAFRSTFATKSGRPEPPVEDAMAKAIRTALGGRERAACWPSCRASARSSARSSGSQGRVGHDTDIVPLYGMLDGKAQDAAIRPAPDRAAQGGAGDVDRGNLDHHRRRARRRRFRSVAAAEDTSRPPASRGWKPCASRGLPPNSAPAAPAARSPASRSGCGAPSRPPRCRPSPRRKYSKPTFPDCCSTARPSAWPTRPRLAFLDPPPGPALNEARALLAALDAIDARRDG